MSDRPLYLRPHLSSPNPADDRPKRTRSTGPGSSAATGQTNAENFYYLKQINSKTPMVLILRDGDSVEGVIEWYDKSCIRILPDDGPGLLIYKEAIRYMYKAERREAEGEDEAGDEAG